ncbi:hypothetical protein CEXT_793211 [Caerostris extrusa]|uniref:Uncharacterized protein n=1 Tax=Caerostris extrusa TaxID=172846 RepID=A0AAV4V725_CAEEX|nr:hypothetical protein CEXT_793211 [Caerostris extrusa]
MIPKEYLSPLKGSLHGRRKRNGKMFYWRGKKTFVDKFVGFFFLPPLSADIRLYAIKDHSNASGHALCNCSPVKKPVTKKGRLGSHEFLTTRLFVLRSINPELWGPFAKPPGNVPTTVEGQQRRFNIV